MSITHNPAGEDLRGLDKITLERARRASLHAWVTGLAQLLIEESNHKRPLGL